MRPIVLIIGLLLGFVIGGAISLAIDDAEKEAPACNGKVIQGCKGRYTLALCEHACGRDF